MFKIRFRDVQGINYQRNAIRQKWKKNKYPSGIQPMKPIMKPVWNKKFRLWELWELDGGVRLFPTLPELIKYKKIIMKENRMFFCGKREEQ